MKRDPATIVCRIVMAVAGGYAAAAALVALCSVALPGLTGMSRSEAVMLSSMLGFVFYLVILVWAFSRQKLSTLAAGLASLTALSLIMVAMIDRLTG